MPQRGFCTDITCPQELTELYECHCCSWLICLKHLLQHVEVTQATKQKQMDNLRNDLTSIVYTLELIIEKKIHEIGRGKELIARAKAKLDASTCPIEEMQQIFEEINQAVAADESEETIVKVETSLSATKTLMCNDEALDDNVTVQDFSSSTRRVLEEIRSPVWNNTRLRSNRSCSSAVSKGMDHSVAMDTDCNSSSMTETTFETVKDEAGVEDRGKRVVNPRAIRTSCPLVFDGAFGLTKEKHQIRMCPVRNRARRLISHFKDYHKLTHVHSLRLCQAIVNGLDPTTTNLFGINEVIIDYDPFIACPFTNSMISLIGCCPTESRLIPCPMPQMHERSLKSHLKLYHRITVRDIETILQTYKSKLLEMKSSKDNRPTSK